MRRTLDIAVISDVHLGTSACQAQEVLNYLTHIEPKILILNGDIIDTKEIKKHHFPPLHFRVIQEIMNMANEGTKVYYILGNHDDVLRNYSNFSSANIHLRDQLILQLKGKKYCFFHGDVFDTVIKYSSWIRHLGGKGYQLLLWLNRCLNTARRQFYQPRISFSKKIKKSSNIALKYINKFETTALEFAKKQGFDYVICGHIHQAKIRVEKQESNSTTYMNSGDWVENMTALEYQWGRWTIYEYDEIDYNVVSPKLHVREYAPKAQNLDAFLKELNTNDRQKMG